MPDNYPDWLKPYIKDDAYMPTSDFIEKLDPQSRLEAMLKARFTELGNQLRNGVDFNGGNS